MHSTIAAGASNTIRFVPVTGLGRTGPSGGPSRALRVLVSQHLRLPP